MLRQYVRNWRMTTIRNISAHESAYPLVSGSFPKRPFPNLYLSSSSTVKAPSKASKRMVFLQIVPWIVYFFVSQSGTFCAHLRNKPFHSENHEIKWTQKVPTGTEILSHETKISDVFTTMINTPPISFIIHLVFHSLKEAFGKMSIQFFRAKELRS